MCAINVLCFLETIPFLTLGTTLGGRPVGLFTTITGLGRKNWRGGFRL